MVTRTKCRRKGKFIAREVSDPAAFEALGSAPSLKATQVWGRKVLKAPAGRRIIRAWTAEVMVKVFQMTKINPKVLLVYTLAAWPDESVKW